MKSFVLLLYLVSVPLLNSSLHAGRIKVTVNSLRNNNGNVCFSLFNKSDGFPNNEEKAMKVVYAKIKDKSSELIFENIPSGNYAIAVFHDENGDKKLDTNFIGIPKEGVGCSNNPKSKFGPPDFEDANFKFSGNELIVNIDLKYL